MGSTPRQSQLGKKIFESPEKFRFLWTKSQSLLKGVDIIKILKRNGLKTNTKKFLRKIKYIA